MIHQRRYQILLIPDNCPFKDSNVENQYKIYPMASDVFNIVYTERLPAFRQICWLLVGCAMSNSAYGRTFPYPKIKLLEAV